MMGKRYIRIVCFTPRGRELAERLMANWTEYIPLWRRREESPEEWAAEGFRMHQPLLFVGAAGIAIRTVAPLVKDKLQDSPVLVMDERGNHIIPLLSGHMGGANALARDIGARIGADPAITTATDVNGCFAIDDFARRNGLRIGNREAIRRVSGKLLSGKKILLRSTVPAEFSGRVPENVVLRQRSGGTAEDTSIPDGIIGFPEAEAPKECLTLIPRKLVVGMGCRKGVRFEKLKEFLERVLEDEGLQPEDIRCIASVDRKAGEPGLIQLAQYCRVPYRLFTPAELERVSGEFPESEFVRRTVGTGNVCHRAAAAAAGGGRVRRGKTAMDGMTLCIVEQEKWHFQWQPERNEM